MQFSDLGCLRSVADKKKVVLQIRIFPKKYLTYFPNFLWNDNFIDRANIRNVRDFVESLIKYSIENLTAISCDHENINLRKHSQSTDL